MKVCPLFLAEGYEVGEAVSVEVWHLVQPDSVCVLPEISSCMEAFLLCKGIVFHLVVAEADKKRRRHFTRVFLGDIRGHAVDVCKVCNSITVEVAQVGANVFRLEIGREFNCFWSKLELSEHLQSVLETLGQLILDPVSLRLYWFELRIDPGHQIFNLDVF